MSDKWICHDCGIDTNPHEVGLPEGWHAITAACSLQCLHNQLAKKEERINYMEAGEKVLLENNDNLHNQLAAKDVIIDKLPKTADGIVVYAGMLVYSINHTGGPYKVYRLSDRLAEIHAPISTCIEFDKLYSTKETKEAAEKKLSENPK